ncbi:hypothetical protein B0H21DRAFT_712200 [Amylocystis lapponica]|nr:hypothetical protein B0H21DRAFT_712200 [Amylocystis lapponica]
MYPGSSQAPLSSRAAWPATAQLPQSLPISDQTSFINNTPFDASGQPAHPVPVPIEYGGPPQASTPQWSNQYMSAGPGYGYPQLFQSCISVLRLPSTSDSLNEPSVSFPGPLTSAMGTFIPDLNGVISTDNPKAGSKKRKATESSVAKTWKRCRELAKDQAAAADPSQDFQVPISGVGPSVVPLYSVEGAPPLVYGHAYSSLARKAASECTSYASDVWYFMRALDSNVWPETMPANQPPSMSRPRNTKFVGYKVLVENEIKAYKDAPIFHGDLLQFWESWAL